MPDPVVALEPEISLIEAPEPLPASSPVPASAITGDKLGEAKVKHWRKVGSGKGDEDDFFEVDISLMRDRMMKMKKILKSTRSNAANIAAATLISQTKSPLKMQAWMNGRLALSRKSSRFELPIDMLLLETMTPLQYLNRYCVVTSRRQMLYDKIFNKHKNIYSGKLGFQDLQKALSDVLIQSIDDEKMKMVIQMLQIDEDVQVEKRLFYGISAFTERLLYPMFVRGNQNNNENQKERIECADFYALKWKFHGVNVNSSIKALLDVL
ncbi:hypothetical protein EB796_021231 [Bugula neritina]|uniref:Uncharacterized protein n=1 Tax=Bugula neritina TaxID=10212 RepID=A0A7J7J3N5_BUGNE|nr:hypothetical protein EB796_021231 [Bugula neritina]